MAKNLPAEISGNSGVGSRLGLGAGGGLCVHGTSGTRGGSTVVVTGGHCLGDG